MLLAFDDTDGPDGGCTTYALFHVLAALEGLAPRGMPRLVRLNPNVPWKTRGNGAVCVELVRPTGPHAVVGEWLGMELRAYPDGDPVAPDEAILATVADVLSDLAQDDAMPSVALFDGPPSSLHYWTAVRTLVEPEPVRTHMAGAGILHRSTGDGRALIGCLGAAAWPGPATSYEFIAYRERAAWGTKRRVAPDRLRGLDATGITFHTEDPEEGVLCCVPNTPCPVLLGLRGTDAERLLQTARSTVPLAVQEPLEGWVLWATNQASGDHVTPVLAWSEADDGMTVRLAATVTMVPESHEGGHVRVRMEDAEGGSVDAMAFEPTKSFRDVVHRLRPGDRVEVTGGLADRTVRLESVAVVSCVPEKTANPACCGRPMKSRGRGAGYKCAVCGATADEDAAQWRDRSELLGTYGVPVMARRHLHRPSAWGPASAPPSGPDASAPTSAATR